MPENKIAIKANTKLGEVVSDFLALPHAKIDTVYRGVGELELTWRQPGDYQDRTEKVLPQHLCNAMGRAVERCQELAELEDHRSGVKAAEELAEEKAAALEPVRQSQGAA